MYVKDSVSLNDIEYSPEGIFSSILQKIYKLLLRAFEIQKPQYTSYEFSPFIIFDLKKAFFSVSLKLKEEVTSEHSNTAVPFFPIVSAKVYLF